MPRALARWGRLTAPVCAVALAFLVAMLASCRAPTQIRIEVTTDVPCANVRGANITVGILGDLEARSPNAWRASCEGGRIGALVVVPSGAKDEKIAFRIVAGIDRAADDCKPPDYGAGCIVARRALAFLPHASLVVPVLMRSECAGVVCPHDQTCVKGGVCVSAEIPDPSTCATPEGCDETELTSPDGGVPDATVKDGGKRDGGDGGDSGVTVTSKVACGAAHACALRPDGRVFCWGDNGAGQLALDPDGGVDGGFATRPLQIPLGAPALDIAVGDTHGCALVANGDVRCWGDNAALETGQIDGGALVLTPSRVSGLANVAEIRLGEFVSCARVAGGKLSCWGDNGAGLLAGASVAMYTATAIDVAVDAGVEQLAMGGRTLCALRAGVVECWGAASKGQTSNPTLFPDPVFVSGIPPARRIAIGSAHSCALAFDGRIFCWGASEYFSLGPSVAVDAGPHPAPVEIALPTVTAIAAGQNRSCATTADAGVLCWGDVTATPTATDPSIASLSEICLGLAHGCGRRADGAILCWGENFVGQLGTGDTSPRAVATPVAFPP